MSDAGDDVVVLDGTGRSTIELARQAVRRGSHVFVNLPRGQSVTDVRSLVGLAEEAGVRVGSSSIFRALPSIRSLKVGRPRLVSIQSSIGDGEEFLDRLVDWLDTCLGLVDSRDVQKLDAESVRTTSGGVAALGVSIRFQNGTLALLHQERGEGLASVSVSGDAGTDRVSLTRHAVQEETASAVRFETRAFFEAVQLNRQPPISVTSAVQTLQLAEYVMRRLRRRAVVTV